MRKKSGQTPKKQPNFTMGLSESRKAAMGFPPGWNLEKISKRKDQFSQEFIEKNLK